MNKSYRMHSKINDFISENFYENRLISDEMNDKQNILVGSKKINGIHLIDLNHKDSSVENETESEYIKIIYNFTWIFVTLKILFYMNFLVNFK